MSALAAEPFGAASSPPLRFGAAGRFELQPDERRLLVDGQAATLGGRALDLLITLASQPGHLFTKGELLDRVWPRLVVEEANLQMQIANLRKVLGGETIATVPGRGYRLVALPVGTAVAAAPVSTAAPATPAAPAAAQAQGAPTAPAAPTRQAGELFGRDADLARLEELLGSGG